jgi:hypothetical protein
MFRPGDVVEIFDSRTEDGHRAYQGQAMVIRKLGDVPDLYEVKMLGSGHKSRCFVYDNEQPGSMEKPNLRIIRGGHDG